MYTAAGLKNTQENRICGIKSEPQSESRLVQPSKMDLSFELGFRPWITAKSIMRDCATRKMVEQLEARRGGERGQDEENQNHRVQQIQKGL